MYCMEGQCHFILASHSPRRKNLLKLLGFPFEVIPSGVEDSAARTRSPSEFVEKNSLVKATAVADKYREKWVLGADTVVVLESEMLGKPADEEEAIKMLLQLSGKTHMVFTGVSLVNRGKGYKQTLSNATKVAFQRFSREEALAYVGTGEPGDKAGAYGAQGAGSALIDAIEGSYTNVVGLPLSLTVRMLKEAGIIEASTVRGRLYQLKNLP